MLIDAFMFFDELDVLEIRLNELNPVVDKFVIAESLESHGSANKKERPLLIDNWERIKPFEHKIIYRCLDHLEPVFSGKDTCWPRENYQRNSLMMFVSAVGGFCPSDATVMVSDCDEIPRAAAIPKGINFLCAATQDLFYYNVNTYSGPWHGTVMGPLHAFQSIGGFQIARDRRDSLPDVPNCGWHFSYFGNLEKIKRKVSNFAHATDYVCTEFIRRGDGEAMLDISAGKDLYRREGVTFSRRESDDTSLPQYFLSHRERFRHLWT